MKLEIVTWQINTHKTYASIHEHIRCTYVDEVSCDQAPKPTRYKTVAVPCEPQGLWLAAHHQTWLVQLKYVSDSWGTDDLKQAKDGYKI